MASSYYILPINIMSKRSTHDVFYMIGHLYPVSRASGYSPVNLGSEIPGTGKEGRGRGHGHYRSLDTPAVKQPTPGQLGDDHCCGHHGAQECQEMVICDIQLEWTEGYG